MKRFQAAFYCRIAVVAALAAAGSPVNAKTLCVAPATTGCYSTIQSAVSAAMPGDTIRVSEGTYKEQVFINKASLSLTADEATVDATGKAWGIVIDSTHNVSISGFRVRNANFAGILVANSSAISLLNNRVRDNDEALAPPHCPGLPSVFAKGEDLDCGEGIFLSGVDHSLLAQNTVTHNAGGILITDDTGPSHDNVIEENEVVYNTNGDCGITLPSHSGAGVYNNRVIRNNSSHNSGPGVGIFAPGPGSKAYGNVVAYNTLMGNGNPGVTMHNHAVVSGAPLPVFNDNTIVGNHISANQADGEDAATAGPTGINVYSLVAITGMIIEGNDIDDESIDVNIKVPAASTTTPQFTLRLNSFARNETGVNNAGTAPVDARLNWWGCRKGPGNDSCATVSGAGVVFDPWLTASPQD